MAVHSETGEKNYSHNNNNWSINLQSYSIILKSGGNKFIFKFNNVHIRRRMAKMVSVWRTVRVRKTLTIESEQCSRESRQNSSHSSSRSSIVNQTKVTKMLLIVSSVFLCFNLPAYVIRIYSYFLIQRNEEPHVNIIIAQRLSHILFDTNYGINFVLYCATGQNFRSMVVHILCHCCQRKNTKTLSSTQRSSQRNLYVGDSGGSVSRQRTITINGPWKETYEMQSF
ncbi:uncharacterized protein LOC122499258 isoform X2 [Leptopilina heterotoma]|uniref:uncharacterized protein LOC122499258 isoform X2 n=1 Tax=Leptopilina heterotoma TaxID=63436 RepID=UPI001CA88C1D|nr:uncharacterized protein LOC122499258 isoform X2 [Leptopilina heterotoma]